MSDQIVSLIRTYVPIFVGAMLTWLGAKAGIVLDQDASVALTVGLTALVTAAYYVAARILEGLHPLFGVLLGSRRQPSYSDEV